MALAAVRLGRRWERAVLARHHGHERATGSAVALKVPQEARSTRTPRCRERFSARVRASRPCEPAHRRIVRLRSQQRRPHPIFISRWVRRRPTLASGCAFIRPAQRFTILAQIADAVGCAPSQRGAPRISSPRSQDRRAAGRHARGQGARLRHGQPTSSSRGSSCSRLTARRLLRQAAVMSPEHRAEAKLEDRDIDLFALAGDVVRAARRPPPLGRHRPV